MIVIASLFAAATVAAATVTAAIAASASAQNQSATESARAAVCAMCSLLRGRLFTLRRAAAFARGARAWCHHVRVALRTDDGRPPWRLSSVTTYGYALYGEDRYEICEPSQPYRDSYAVF